MNQTFGRFLSASTYVVGIISVTCSVATSESVPTNAEMTNLQTEIQPFNSHNAISITEEDAQQLELSLETDAMNQVTSVSQLSDVQPTYWAFQALQLLVERYGIIAGYPDSTFRGNRAMTRYEFAAGLNAALNRINELVASGKTDLVTKDDLITLQKLQEEFAVELAAMQQRVDGLETRTEQLESHQFSTTTKLEGEAIFALSDAFGEKASEDSNTVFQQRVRLNFQTSFTGKDRLKTRIEFGNFEQFDFPTNEGRLGFDSDTEGDFELGDLEYRFPIGNKVTVLPE